MSNLESLLGKIKEAEFPDIKDLIYLLSLEGENDLNILFSFADKVRRDFCGDGILLRGIVEFSNYCTKNCFYCGLNKNNLKIKRYRMTQEEILKSVEFMAGKKVKTVVLQSGDDLGMNASWLKDVILEIKSRFDMAITLSVGERSYEEYEIWKEAGADRYLLKIETSDKSLYESIHEGMSFDNRLECLDNLRRLDYQVGSGNIVGLPGQTLGIIAEDIAFFKEKGFDMIGIGPFIPHGESRLSGQKRGDFLLTLKTLALTRIVTKDTHIPATTALGSLEKDYRLDGLSCGANVLMPNFTLKPYRKLYEIYPNKRCVNEPVGSCDFCMDNMANKIGRFIDYGRGDSLKKQSLERGRYV